jgi:uncharacterized YccA/Bax inhibitor family protein
VLSKISEFIVQAQAYTKFIVAVVGGLVTVLAAFIPSEWSPIIQAVLAAATAFSVYAFPNVTVDAPAHRAE